MTRGRDPSPSAGAGAAPERRVEDGADGAQGAPDPLERGREVAEGGDRLDVAHDDDDHRDGRGGVQLAADGQPCRGAAEDEEHHLRGDREKQLTGDLHEHEPAVGAVLAGQGTAHLAAGRLDPTGRAQCLLRAAELDDPPGELGVGARGGPVHPAAESAGPPHRPEEHGDPCERGHAERPGDRQQRETDDHGQQQRLQERREQVDDDAHEVGPGRRDRRARARRVLRVEPLQRDPGETLGDLVLRVVEGREAQVEADGRDPRVEEPAEDDARREPRDPRPGGRGALPEEGADEREQQHRGHRTQGDRDDGEQHEATHPGPGPRRHERQHRRDHRSASTVVRSPASHSSR